MNAHCRIGRVRMKTGGDVTVLNPQKRGEVGQGIMDSVLLHGMGDECWKGYALVVWDDGASAGHEPQVLVSYQESLRVPVAAIPEIVKTWLLRNQLT